jgi:hypothetical protein
MRSKRFKVCIVLIAMLIGVATEASADPLAIATTTDASVLANTILGANIALVGGSSSLVGTSLQQGTFSGGTDILPFGNGIILTTGQAIRAPGPNNTETRGTNAGTNGTAELDALAGSTTYDANVLMFSFIPTYNFVSLQFVFASEEYHERVGRPVVDALGFFLNGENIALVPGTDTPVNINSINCNTNSEYYNANPFVASTSPCGGTALNIQYDGLAGGLYSTALYASGFVTAGVVNTITLSIADASDRFLDSAVFIGAESFTSEQRDVTQTVPEPSSLMLLGAGLALAALRSFKKSRRP